MNSTCLRVAMVLAVACRAGAAPPASSSAAPRPASAGFDGGAIIMEVWERVNASFFDPAFGGVDWDAALDRHLRAAAEAKSLDEIARIVNQMLGRLDASHTSFHTRDDQAYYELLDICREALPQQLITVVPDGDVRYEGIGIATVERDGRRFVADIFDGGPAVESGLLVGDEIIAADGAAFHPIRSFRGKAGQAVRLLVQRHADAASRRELNVTPAMIAPQELYRESILKSARVFERDGHQIGYVRVRSFAGAEQHEALKEALQSPPLNQAAALVLDLRGGWGGANPDVINLFNRNVPALTMTGRDGRAMWIDPIWRRPVGLLVDGGTRSGKEALTFAFKQHAIGPVIGARTAGAVLGGRPFVVADGAALLIVAVADVRVDGVRLEGVGVAPDIAVPFELPYAAGVDPQCDRAVEVMGERLKEQSTDDADVTDSDQFML